MSYIFIIYRMQQSITVESELSSLIGFSSVAFQKVCLVLIFPKSFELGI